MPVQTKNPICEAFVDRMPSKYQEKKQNIEEKQKESGLWKNKVRSNVNPAKIGEESCGIYEVTQTNQLIQVSYT